MLILTYREVAELNAMAISSVAAINVSHGNLTCREPCVYCVLPSSTITDSLCFTATRIISSWFPDTTCSLITEKCIDMSSKEKAPNVDRARLCMGSIQIHYTLVADAYIIVIADDLKNVTNSAVKVAVNALEIASHMVQNVSYLAIISSVLTQFIKAHDVRRRAVLSPVYRVLSDILFSATQPVQVRVAIHRGPRPADLHDR